MLETETGNRNQVKTNLILVSENVVSYDVPPSLHVQVFIGPVSMRVYSVLRHLCLGAMMNINRMDKVEMSHCEPRLDYTVDVDMEVADTR
jgi:hypothetical protein